MKFGNPFKGKIDRKHYVISILGTFLCWLVGMPILYVVIANLGDFFSQVVQSTLTIVIAIALVVYGLSAIIRRLRDAGFSEIWVLVPLVNVALFIALFFIPSYSETDQKNSPNNTEDGIDYTKPENL